jgi:carboxylesterase
VTATRDETEPFDLDGDGSIGVVCVHGFTGTPYDMRYLGGELARAGYHVHGLRLPGHGTSVEDLDETRWTEWADAVEDAFDAMRLSCNRVALVGLSLGGLLSLHVAARRPEVAAVASLAAPLWLEGLSARVAAWAVRGVLTRVAPMVRAIPKIGGSDIRDPVIKAKGYGYPAIPVRALAQLVQFMELVEGELDQVKQPVLVVHAEQDHTAPLACARMIAERTRAVRTRILPRSYHVIANDVERDIVAAEVSQFLRRYIPAA